MAKGVDDAPMTVFHDGSITKREWCRVLEGVGVERVAQGVDEEALETIGLVECHDGSVTGEGAGVEVAGRYDGTALQVCVAVEIAFGHQNASFGRYGDTVVDAGNEKTSGGVNESALAVVQPDATVSVVEFVDVSVGWRNDDGAVDASETIEGVVANGLDAVNVTDITSTGGVVLVDDVLGVEGRSEK